MGEYDSCSNLLNSIEVLKYTDTAKEKIITKNTIIGITIQLPIATTIRVPTV